MYYSLHAVENGSMEWKSEPLLIRSGCMPNGILYQPYGPWSKVVHYVGNKVSFWMHPYRCTNITLLPSLRYSPPFSIPTVGRRRLGNKSGTVQRRETLNGI